MRLCHPDLDAIVDTGDTDYIAVLADRGWVEAPALPELGDLSASTVDDILTEVGADPEKAALALEEERAGKGRSTLIAALEQIVADE